MGRKRLRKQGLTQTELAAALGISRPAVSNLKKRGMPVTSLEEAVAWRRTNIYHKPVGTIGDETARLKAAQADVAELEAAKLKGELIDIEEVNYVWSAGITAMVAQMEGLPGRMANELAGCTDAAQVELRLREEIRRIRSSLAEELGRIAFLAGERFSTPAS